MLRTKATYCPCILNVRMSKAGWSDVCSQVKGEEAVLTPLLFRNLPTYHYLRITRFETWRVYRWWYPLCASFQGMAVASRTWVNGAVSCPWRTTRTSTPTIRCASGRSASTAASGSCSNSKTSLLMEWTVRPTIWRSWRRIMERLSVSEQPFTLICG